ncbi:MAG: hypothetical protein ACFFAU_19035 [Candidatus Hodarchaeota archaeon]
MGQIGWNLFELWLSNPLLAGGTFVIFFFLDVKLTRLNFSLSQREYRKHVKHEVYELNPFHQEEIHQNKPLKRATWVLWGLIFLVVVFISSMYTSPYADRALIECGIGVLFFLYFEVILNHLASLVHFRFFMENPDVIQGEIVYSAVISYGTKQKVAFHNGLFWVIVFLLVNQPFFLGGFLGAIVKVWITRQWGSRVIDQINKGEFTPLTTEEDVCPICKKKRHPLATYCTFCGVKLN